MIVARGERFGVDELEQLATGVCGINIVGEEQGGEIEPTGVGVSGDKTGEFLLLPVGRGDDNKLGFSSSDATAGVSGKN